MLCHNCNENEANVKYTQIINGTKKQMNLCDKCANKLGINNISFNMPSINFSNFLEDVFKDDGNIFMPDIIKPETLLCDKCNTSYDDFIKNGKFGCDNCYDEFKSKIDLLLKNIHGVNRHVGRIGSSIERTDNINKTGEEKVKDNKKTNSNEDIINKLKEKLKVEIKEERYEDAAKTRDEIKKLEK